MNILQAQRIGRRLQQKVENYTGVDFQAATYGFNGSDIAATSGNAIGFNKDWLANASRREVKGVITHELGHVLQGKNSTLSGVQQESYGDALRQALGFGKGAGYSSTQETQMERLSREEFRKLSSQAAGGDINRTWLKEASMAGTDGNGPKVGDGNRRRNTFANMLSKSNVDLGGAATPKGGNALPALTPSQSANYFAQLQGLYAGYQNQLAQLKLQRVGARAGFREAAAGIRSEKLASLASVENAGIERGMAGASAVSQDLAGVRGAAEAAKVSALNAKRQAIAGTKLEEQQAGTNYFMSVQQLEAQKLAQQQEQLGQQLEQNLIVSGQESSMDVLKAIYKSFMQQSGRGGNGGGGGGKTITRKDLEKFLRDATGQVQAGQTFYGKPLY